MIKVILFDFDGVLPVDKTESQSMSNDLSVKTGIPFDTQKAMYAPFHHNRLIMQHTARLYNRFQ